MQENRAHESAKFAGRMIKEIPLVAVYMPIPYGYKMIDYRTPNEGELYLEISCYGETIETSSGNEISAKPILIKE